MSDPTDFDALHSFFRLTPERVLEACEVGGRRATGFAMALNSLENRVYEVAFEDGPSLVAKFYRPGRWSRAAIADEHAFLAELAAAEVPVVAPLALGEAGLAEAATLGHTGGIDYALFPKIRARVPEELRDDELAQIGRLLARLHLVGETRRAPARPTLDADFYGVRSLARLAQAGVISPHIEARYVAAAERLLAACRALWPATVVRLHGDCHLGNLLSLGARGDTAAQLIFVDFDDFLHGPPAQDLWLVAPGRDAESQRARALVAEAYREMRALPADALRLVEPLRGLRILRYAAWIAERWEDPAFPRAFPAYLDDASWQRELSAIEEQATLAERAVP